MELKPKYLRIDFPDILTKRETKKVKPILNEKLIKINQKYTKKDYSASHYNMLIGYSRIPNKYDHFHEKTYLDNYLPILKSQSHSKILHELKLSEYNSKRHSESPFFIKKKLTYQAINKYIMPSSRKPTAIRKKIETIN